MRDRASTAASGRLLTYVNPYLMPIFALIPSCSLADLQSRHVTLTTDLETEGH